jgi:hypothetical protein
LIGASSDRKATVSRNTWRSRSSCITATVQARIEGVGKGAEIIMRVPLRQPA